jgi:hypothetical protein
VTFDAKAVDAMLSTVGRAPWPEPRPSVLVLLAVQTDARQYVLTSDSPHGIDQRESLQAVSIRMGLPVILPSQAALKSLLPSTPLTPAQLQAADLEALFQAATAVHANAVLVGTMAWKDSALGWDVRWNFLAKEKKIKPWSIDGVSFDDGFRSGVGGAVQILSGHAENGQVSPYP